MTLASSARRASTRSSKRSCRSCDHTRAASQRRPRPTRMWRRRARAARSEENEEDAVASPASRARLSGAAPPNPEELRTEATLCLCALTAGNPISQAAAKKAGALEAVATLFDQSAEWEGAYLGAMAMQALGLSDPKAQEKAIAVAAGAGLEARTGTLKAVWAMKAEPERWASG